MTKGDSGLILELHGVKPEGRSNAPPSQPAETADPRLESEQLAAQPAPEAPRARQETLAERLDHALDEIRRMMVADRARGPL